MLYNGTIIGRRTWTYQSESFVPAKKATGQLAILRAATVCPTLSWTSPNSDGSLSSKKEPAGQVALLPLFPRRVLARQVRYEAQIPRLSSRGKWTESFQPSPALDVIWPIQLRKPTLTDDVEVCHRGKERRRERRSVDLRQRRKLLIFLSA